MSVPESIPRSVRSVLHHLCLQVAGCPLPYVVGESPWDAEPHSSGGSHLRVIQDGESEKATAATMVSPDGGSRGQRKSRRSVESRATTDEVDGRESMISGRLFNNESFSCFSDEETEAPTKNVDSMQCHMSQCRLDFFLPSLLFVFFFIRFFTFFAIILLCSTVTLRATAFCKNRR